MATPSSEFTQAVVLSHDYHKKDIVDNISRANPLLFRLNKKGNLDLMDGGRRIVIDIEYAENDGYQRIHGDQIIQLPENDFLTSAEYERKTIALPVKATGRQIRENRGKERIYKMAMQKRMNAENTFKNRFAQDIFSAGLLTNQIGGLQLLVADDGLGTVGGIDSSTYTWWQNIVQSAASPLQGGGAITPSSSTIQSMMLPLYMRLTDTGQKPDIIVCDHNYYVFYHDSLTQYARYTGNDDKATGGFQNLKYMNADVFFDDVNSVPSNHMYFLTSEHLKLYAHEDANFTALDKRFSINQDAEVVIFLWEGNLVTSKRSAHGVLKA